MCLFYRYLTLCPRENLLKMLPEGAIFWVRKTPVLGHRSNNFVSEEIEKNIWKVRLILLENFQCGKKY